MTTATKPKTEIKITIESEGQDLSKKSVYLKLSIGRLGNRKKVSAMDVEVDADKNLIRVSKSLLSSKELQNILNLDQEIRKYVYDNCLPFDTGVHLIPFPMIEGVDKKLRELSERRKALIEIFLEAYPKLVQEQSGRLRAIYNPNDYPSVERVREKFSFAWRYVNFGVPGQLKNISAEIFKEEREKAAKVMQDAAAEIQNVMRESLAELVKHLADRLENDKDGKPKMFKEATITKLKEFLDTFDFRNIVNDQELKEQVEKARALISGVTGESIRTSDSLRASLKKGIDAIGAKLDTLVVDKPKRQIHFDEV